METSKINPTLLTIGTEDVKDAEPPAAVEWLRAMIDIDMEKGRSWVVDYVKWACYQLGYCPYCGKKAPKDDKYFWSTSYGCMPCYNAAIEKGLKKRVSKTTNGLRVEPVSKRNK